MSTSTIKCNKQKHVLMNNNINIISDLLSLMSSIRDLYIIATRSATNGIEGYHVDSKYIDPKKIKQQRILSTSTDKIISKPTNVSKKTTFIDQLQKRSAKLPGPSTYEPKRVESKSKTTEVVPATRRKTIFDQMQQLQKKYNHPAAGKYDKIIIFVDKTKQKSNLNKAHNVNYLQSSMRSSLDCPGVGNYYAYHQMFDHRGSKWITPKQIKNNNKTNQSIKLPSVGTYNPSPVAYNLFDSISWLNKKKQLSYFNKEQRFKSNSKDKIVPFYNVLSQWGMKNKMQKKDIFTLISSPRSNRSVYY